MKARDFFMKSSYRFVMLFAICNYYFYITNSSASMLRHSIVCI